MSARLLAAVTAALLLRLAAGSSGPVVSRDAVLSSIAQACLNASAAAETERRISAGQQQIVSGQLLIQSGQQQLLYGQQQMATGQQQITFGQQQINTGQKQLETGQEQLHETQQRLEAEVQEILSGQQQLKAELQQILPGQQQLKTELQQILSGQQQLEAGLQQLQERQTEGLQQLQERLTEMDRRLAALQPAEPSCPDPPTEPSCPDPPAEPSPDPPAGPDRCPDGWTYDADACFLIPPSSASWYAALGECARQDPRARLASVSWESVDTVWGLAMATGSRVWLGLARGSRDEDWRWVDGAPLDYVNWLAGYPKGYQDRRCAVVDGRNWGSWINQSCDMHFPFLCQISLA